MSKANHPGGDSRHARVHAVRHDCFADDKGFIEMLVFMCLRSHSQASPERHGVATIRKADCATTARPNVLGGLGLATTDVGISEDSEREDCVRHVVKRVLSLTRRHKVAIFR